MSLLPRMRLFARAFALLFERRAQVILGVLCMPISAVLTLGIATLLGQVVDRLQRGSTAGDTPYDRGALAIDCAWLAGIALADASLRFTGRHLLINASRHMEARLKSELAAHLGTLRIGWFDRVRTGDLLSRLTQDVELVRFVTGPSLLYGSSAIVLVPGGVWLMLSFSPLVAVAACLAFGGLLFGISRLMPELQRHSKSVQEAIGAISQRAAESFSGVRVLLAYARSVDEVRSMRGLGDDYVAHSVALARLRARFNLLVHGCSELVVLAVVVLGAIEVGRGNLTSGQLLSFLALLGAMVGPLITIGWIVASWHRATAAAERIEDVFAQESEPSAGLSIGDGQPTIEVRDLTFRFQDQDRPALDAVSLRIEAGTKVGLVGPVGAGKSTLFGILLRFYDPPAGTVFVDGVDILAIDPEELRRLFAYAPQDPFLFSDSLAGNISFGAESLLERPGDAESAERELVLAAAATANLDPDLDRFASGLDTVIGERGVTLSGGQKQRVSLARALAANREVLLLDDTLSAVDVATETRILQRLQATRAGSARPRGAKTSIVAAHRLSIVADAAQILVFDAGRIVARGNHAELLAQPGYYAETWRRQREELPD